MKIGHIYSRIIPFLFEFIILYRLKKKDNRHYETIRKWRSSESWNVVIGHVGSRSSSYFFFCERST